MSLLEIIGKQLKSYPKFKKQARISYFESIPLKQVHIDTMFWQASGKAKAPKIPILVIVDVATRYTRYFVQKSKNENVLGFLKDFVKDVTTRFPTETENMLVITDGAKELRLKTTIDNIKVVSKISKGVNKAVLAEVAIRKARAILRDYEVRLNLGNLENGTDHRIDGSNLREIFSMLEEQVNAKAKLRKPKPPTPFSPPGFQLGDPVFALNFYKYFPHALKSTMVKRGYMQNWYYEPFYISKVFLIQGIYKYSLKSYATTVNSSTISTRINSRKSTLSLFPITSVST
jgi:hypothetical protein